MEDRRKPDNPEDRADRPDPDTRPNGAEPQDVVEKPSSEENK